MKLYIFDELIPPYSNETNARCDKYSMNYGADISKPSAELQMLPEIEHKIHNDLDSLRVMPFAILAIKSIKYCYWLTPTAWRFVFARIFSVRISAMFPLHKYSKCSVRRNWDTS